MQLPEEYDDCGSHKSRILTWIEAVEAGPPEALKPRNNRLKHYCEQCNSITSPPERKASRNPTKRRPLVPTSRNTMSPQKKTGQTPYGKRRRSPRKHLHTTSQDAHEHDQDENEDVDKETPRPSASVHSRERTTEPGIHGPVPLPPPIFKGPRPDNASAALPTRSSVTSSSLSESLSNAGSVSPVKQFVDFDMAERPMVAELPKYKGAMGSMNITTACIQPKSLAMTHASGMKTGSKMVDFAMYMKPDKEMKDKIRYTLCGDLKESQSVNQTMHGPLRMCPIAISVETKLPDSGGDMADIQSAIWMGAGLARIRQMLPKSEKIPTMPSLLAHGHQLHLIAFQEQVDSNVMYGKLALCSSNTLLGTFQMAKALEVLVDWANTDYRAW